MAAAYMDTSAGEMTADAPLDEAAARALLAQKEEDLLLAAELGKALLEKNEQLSSENERTASEYARHLEGLEQERHMLRLRIAAMEGEHEDEVVQLQTDIAAIRQQLQAQQHSGKDCDKQRSQMLEDMTEQNQRLARQLRDASKAEKHITEQLEQLRRQQDLRRNSFEFHVSHVDEMKEELASLEEQRLALERRERSLLADRAQLEERLRDSTERQLLLERLQRERSGQVRDQRRQLDQLAAANSSLGDRLDAAAGLGSPASTGHTSLHHELDSSADEGIGSVSHPPSAEVTLMDLGDEVECDEPSAANAGTSALQQLRQEALLTTSQLRALTEQARVGRTQTDPSQTGTDPSLARTDSALGGTDSALGGTDSALGGIDSALGGTDSVMSVPPVSDPSLDVTLMDPVAPDGAQHQLGDLRAAFLALQAELASLLPAVSVDEACRGCGRPAQLPLQEQLHTVSQRHEQLLLQHQQQTETLQQLQTELDRHDKQLTMKEKQCTALQEEKEVLKTELDAAYVTKEDLVRKSWEARDQAVQRKNAAELELSKARIDVLQTNSQLLESIQHKVQLSCQLDQWQWDMQELIDAEIHKKLVSNENPKVNSSTTTASARGRRSFMRFFGRS